MKLPKNGAIISTKFNSTKLLKRAFTMERLLRLGQGGLGGMGAGAGQESAQNDTAEQIHISSLALLKMMKHGRAGVPFEVMGLMLGEFIDDFTVR